MGVVGIDTNGHGWQDAHSAVGYVRSIEKAQQQAAQKAAQDAAAAEEGIRLVWWE